MWLVIYPDLRDLAARRLAAERVGHALAATDLVHETFLRLADVPAEPWVDHAHLFRAAANAMRLTLIDHARARARGKRGGGGTAPLPLTEAADVAVRPDDARLDARDAVALNAALARLTTVHPDAAEVVRLRFYAGLCVERTAQALNTSPMTVKRRWTYARAWLRRELTANR